MYKQPLIFLRYKILPQSVLYPKYTNFRLFHDEFDRTRMPTAREKEIALDKQNLQWRTPIIKNPNTWRSNLGLFVEDDKDTKTFNLLAFMQQPIDLRLKTIKMNREKKRRNIEIAYQQYLPERNNILGNDLAAAHFIVHRGGSVKFVNQENWIKKNEYDEYKLPRRFTPEWKVEGMRCDNMELYYEGLENIRELKSLKFLSFHNVETFDNWCLDRVSGSNYDNLEILDLSGTQITENGLTSLYRLPTLKMLILDDPNKSIKYELICAMLEEIIIGLKICKSSQIHDL